MLKKKLIQRVCIHHISIIIICSLLFFDFYWNGGNNSQNSVVVSIKNPKFSLLTPYNTLNEYSVDDVYNTLLDIKNFSFLINPQPCQNTSSLLLAIIVSSKPTHYDNRKVIRNTWGITTEATRVFFLIGNSSNNDTVNEMIANESFMHGDIIKGSFVDTYRNMTYKHVMGLKWIAHHCSTAKYILKADDDVVVNILRLRHFLVRDLSPWGAKGLITCQVLSHAFPLRKNSKWTVSKQEYSKEYYPPYCAGWAILYSQDVIPRLLQAAQTIDFFWIDDVQITGVAAEKVGVARTPLSSLVLKSFEILKHNPKVIIEYLLMGPPNCNISEMEVMWEKYSLAQRL